VVAAFLAQVRVGCDAAAASRLMAPQVTAHQLVAADLHTVVRTPEEYVEHARDLRREHAPFTFELTAAIEQADLVHVRFVQRGRDLELGSVDYRVEAGRVAEYWIQLDHHRPTTAAPTTTKEKR
jgi:hypothetical protein